MECYHQFLLQLHFLFSSSSKSPVDILVSILKKRFYFVLFVVKVHVVQYSMRTQLIPAFSLSFYYFSSSFWKPFVVRLYILGSFLGYFKRFIFRISSP